MDTFLNAILGPLGALAGAVLVIMALATGRVVPRSYWVDMKLDRDYWRRMALSGTSLARRALDVKKQEVEADSEGAL